MPWTGHPGPRLGFLPVESLVCGKIHRPSGPTFSAQSCLSITRRPWQQHKKSSLASRVGCRVWTGASRIMPRSCLAPIRLVHKLCKPDRRSLRLPSGCWTNSIRWKSSCARSTMICRRGIIDSCQSWPTGHLPVTRASWGLPWGQRARNNPCAGPGVTDVLDCHVAAGRPLLPRIHNYPPDLSLQRIVAPHRLRMTLFKGDATPVYWPEGEWSIFPATKPA